MPQGDPQRTWFPEMIERLRAEWRDGMSIPDVIELRDQLDEMLQDIRTSRKIQTPIITCKKCGKTGPAASPRVSVRALILSLSRFGITSLESAKALEKQRARFRSEHELDLYGKISSETSEGCV
jgi:hypothetical protein